MTKLVLPENIAYCIARLNGQDHAAYVVGGCVRDTLLGREPEDWDICTGASPEEICLCFSEHRTILTGARHGTVTVLVGERRVEITTFRRDGAYSDHRRPDQVAFTHSLEQDLSRRDFTVNALAYHPREGLRDLFGGRADLEARVLRCVGDAPTRFTEDALRILRLFRFCGALGFTPDPAALEAAAACRELLDYVSAERISAELSKLLLSPAPGQVLIQMTETGVLQQLLPEFAECVGFRQNTPYHNRTVDRHIFAAVDGSPPRLAVRLALLLHDIEKPRCYREDADGVGHFKGHEQRSAMTARKILDRLRWDRRTSDRAVRLIDLHNLQIPTSPPELRKLLSRLGESFLADLLAVRLADTRAKNPAAAARRLRSLERAQALLPEILAQGPPLSLGQLGVSGRDLLELGFPPGRALGEALDALLDWVLEEPERNSREALLERAKTLLPAATSKGG